MRSLYPIPLFSLIFGFHFNVSAEQNARAQHNSSVEVETIVTTANRGKTNHLDLVGNTSQIDQRALEKVNAEHMSSILKLASGAWLSRGNGQESLLALRSPVLTGAGSCAEFLTLENGIALRAPGFCNVNQLFDSHFELASGVEVVKGANSARYGSNAIHGLVNVISAQLNGPNKLSLDVGNDAYFRVNGVYNVTGEEVDFGVATTLTSDGGFQHSSGYQQQKVSLAAAHDFKSWQTTHRLTVTQLDQETAGYLQRGKNAYKDKSLLRINDFPDAYRNSVSVRYSMTNDWQEESVAWQIVPYLRYTDMDFLMHFLPGTPVEENGHHSIGLQISRIEQILSSTRLKFGVDVDFSDGYLTQFQASDTESSSAFLRAVLPRGAHYDYDVKSRNLALYTQVDHQLTDDSTIVAIARFDNVQYDYRNNLSVGNLKSDGTECGFGGCRYTRPESQKNDFSNVSFSLGYIHQLDESARLFIKYDDSFRAPHTAELYRLQNGQLTSDVKSVKAAAHEIGLRFDLQNVFAEVSLYRLKKSDGIYQDANRQYLNGLDTLHRGVEFDVNWRLNKDLMARLNTSVATHRYLNNPLNGKLLKGNDVDTAPKLMSNLIFDWQVVNDIGVQLQFNYLDDYFLDAENEHIYSGHTIVDLSAEWQLDTRTAVSVKINNVLDTRYAERADYAFGNYRYFVGEPTNINASLRYQF